jgi:hypothetical protein
VLQGNPFNMRRYGGGVLSVDRRFDVLRAAFTAIVADDPPPAK